MLETFPSYDWDAASHHDAQLTGGSLLTNGYDYELDANITPFCLPSKKEFLNVVRSHLGHNTDHTILITQY